MGYLAASSPAYGDKKIYVTILERTKGVRAGRVAAIWAKTGKVAWSKPLPSRSESSPMVVDHRVYFGSENGDRLRDARRDDGSVQWKFQAGGAAKGGLALNDGKLYFGTYGGHVYAIAQHTGKQVWHAGTSGANVRPLAPATSTPRPAVAYGRVYIGNTDGNMYSFSPPAASSPGGAGPAPTCTRRPPSRRSRGSKPTVYFGSYDGTFYALDARTGRTRWTFRDGGKISGAATVVGDLVYYSNWGKREHHRAVGQERQAGVVERARRVQPGRLRRPDDLRDRLLVGRGASSRSPSPRSARKERRQAKVEKKRKAAKKKKQRGQEEGRAKKKKQRPRRRRPRRQEEGRGRQEEEAGREEEGARRREGEGRGQEEEPRSGRRAQADGGPAPERRQLAASREWRKRARVGRLRTSRVAWRR